MNNILIHQFKSWTFFFFAVGKEPDEPDRAVSESHYKLLLNKTPCTSCVHTIKNTYVLHTWKEKKSDDIWVWFYKWRRFAYLQIRSAPVKRTVSLLQQKKSQFGPAKAPPIPPGIFTIMSKKQYFHYSHIFAYLFGIKHTWCFSVFF